MAVQRTTTCAWRWPRWFGRRTWPSHCYWDITICQLPSGRTIRAGFQWLHYISSAEWILKFLPFQLCLFFACLVSECWNNPPPPRRKFFDPRLIPTCIHILYRLFLYQKVSKQTVYLLVVTYYPLSKHMCPSVLNEIRHHLHDFVWILLFASGRTTPPFNHNCFIYFYT